MEMQVLPWIKDDVAIEIIGKMISFQVRSLYDVLNAYRSVGFEVDSLEVKSNKDYQYHDQRIKELYAEIQQIYYNQNKDAIINKAYNEYAPYVKGRYQAKKENLI
jgi:uncharacterized protein YecE (DUF72 family)